jgi:hypothetical protein
VHRLLNATANSTARIVVVDTNGVQKRVMISPGTYGVGLEYLDGKLIVGERDGSKYLYVCNPTNAAVISQVLNPFQEFYGPRCLAYDGESKLYQVSTLFGSGSGGLQAAYLVRMDKNNLAKEVDRMELINGSGSSINARGVEYDPRDKNYWITDLSGNIFKIANFDTPNNPLSDISTSGEVDASGLIISPNPARDKAVIGFMTGKVEANVRLEVFNLIGEKVATLIDGTVSMDDTRAAILDCSSLPNGMYTVSLTIDGVSRPSEKIIVSK